MANKTTKLLSLALSFTVSAFAMEKATNLQSEPTPSTHTQHSPRDQIADPKEAEEIADLWKKYMTAFDFLGQAEDLNSEDYYFSTGVLMLDFLKQKKYGFDFLFSQQPIETIEENFSLIASGAMNLLALEDLKIQNNQEKWIDYPSIQRIGFNVLLFYTKDEHLDSIKRYTVADELIRFNQKRNPKTPEHPKFFPSVEEWRASSIQELDQHFQQREKEEGRPFLYQITKEGEPSCNLVGSQHNVSPKHLHRITHKILKKTGVLIRELDPHIPLVIKNILYVAPAFNGNEEGQFKKSSWTKDLLYNTKESISKGENWVEALSSDSKRFLQEFIEPYIKRVYHVQSLSEVSPLAVLKTFQVLDQKHLAPKKRSCLDQFKGMDFLWGLLLPTKSEGLETDSIRNELLNKANQEKIMSSSDDKLDYLFWKIESGYDYALEACVGLGGLPYQITGMNTAIEEIEKGIQNTFNAKFSLIDFFDDSFEQDLREAVSNLIGEKEAKELSNLESINYELKLNKKYLKGDAKEITRDLETQENNSEITKKNPHISRNLYWAHFSLPRILEKHAGQNITVMVGVGHLFGQGGLLDLFNQQGYTIKRYFADGILGTEEEIKDEINLA